MAAGSISSRKYVCWCMHVCMCTLGNYALFPAKTSLFKFNICSLSTFPQVIATGTAVSVGGAPGHLPGQLKALKHILVGRMHWRLKHTQKDALNNLVGVHFSCGFFLSLFLHGGFLRGFFFHECTGHTL